MIQELIDEQTGEIIEMDERGAQLIVEDLPRICRALKAIEAHQGEVAEYLKAEINRISFACTCKLESLGAQHKRLSVMAEGLLRQSGKKRLEYPGLGVVRIGWTRESVDTVVYDELSVDGQKSFQSASPELFKISTKVTPDKAFIRGEIANGREWDGVPLFSVRPKQERFEFKSNV